jgi:hypothetical protein
MSFLPPLPESPGSAAPGTLLAALAWPPRHRPAPKRGGRAATRGGPRPHFNPPPRRDAQVDPEVLTLGADRPSRARHQRSVRTGSAAQPVLAAARPGGRPDLALGWCPPLDSVARASAWTKPGADPAAANRARVSPASSTAVPASRQSRQPSTCSPTPLPVLFTQVGDMANGQHGIDESGILRKCAHVVHQAGQRPGGRRAGVVRWNRCGGQRSFAPASPD